VGCLQIKHSSSYQRARRRELMLVPAVQGTLPAYRGSCLRLGRSHVYQFEAFVLGRNIYLGCFTLEDAKEGARMYDALHLLLYGARAKTNFEWSTYTRADIAAAAQLLQDKGLDVHKAIMHARLTRPGGEWYGVNATRGVSWRAYVCCSSANGSRKEVVWWGLPTAEAAAHQADAGRLAVTGLGCTTNFPASSYTKLQLEEVGRYATSKGTETVHVAACLEAVEQVCDDFVNQPVPRPNVRERARA
jgi:hypothetical protein